MDLAAFEGTYCGQAVLPDGLWMQWNLDPPVLVGLALLTVLLRHSLPGLAAVGVLAVAFVSPLCAVTASLFSARVVHHLLMILVAAPLLATALPARRPMQPGMAFALATVTLWLWHLPAAYDLALGNMAIYWLMQVSLLATWGVFWRSVLHPRQDFGPAVLGVFGAYLQMALLGALLTFAPDPLYAIHAVAPPGWGLLPLEDQQLGGLIMWIPGGLPFLAIAALMARRGWHAWGEAR